MPTPPDAATEPPPLTTATIPPPPPLYSAPPVPAPPIALPPPTPFLDEAERDFDAGQYEDAARAYQRHLATAASDKGKDWALLRLGLSTALSDRSAQSPWRARVHLQQLVSQYPRSPYAEEARLILGLIQEVQQLKTDLREKEDRLKRLSSELQRLKRIDMQRRAPRAP